MRFRLAGYRLMTVNISKLSLQQKLGKVRHGLLYKA